MSTIRTKKEPGDYFLAHKTPAQDKRLSYKARGIHNYLMSKPDDWTLQVTDLVRQSDQDGAHAVRAALKELEEFGYLEKAQARKAGKFKGYDYIMYEVPPCSDNPHTEKPNTENRELNNNESTNNDITNTKEGRAAPNNNGAKPKKPKKKRDPLLDHPAIIEYREIARFHVPIVWREQVVEAVGDNVDLWKSVVFDWIGRGYNPRNVKDMLDAFHKGGLPNKNGNGRRPMSTGSARDAEHVAGAAKYARD